MFPEGCEGGDTGDVGLVRTGRHVTERLQLPLRAVVADVAVEHRGWNRQILDRATADQNMLLRRKDSDQGSQSHLQGDFLPLAVSLWYL